MKITSTDAVVRYVLKEIHNDPSLRKSNELYFSMEEIAENTGFALSTFKRDPGKYESSLWYDTDFGKYFDSGFFGISLFDEALIQFNWTLRLKKSIVLDNPRYSSLWGLNPDEVVDSKKIIQKCRRKIKAASDNEVLNNENCCVDLIGAFIEKKELEKYFEGNLLYCMQYRGAHGYCNIEGPEERYVVMVNDHCRLIRAYLNNVKDVMREQEDFQRLREMIQKCIVDDGHFYDSVDRKYTWLFQ